MQSLRAVWRLHSGTQQQQGQQGQPPAAVAGVSMAGACTPRHQYRSLLPWCVSSATGAYRCYHVRTRPSMPSACSTLEYRRRRRARGYVRTVRRTPIREATRPWEVGIHVHFLIPCWLQPTRSCISSAQIAPRYCTVTMGNGHSIVSFSFIFVSSKPG